MLAGHFNSLSPSPFALLLQQDDMPSAITAAQICYLMWEQAGCHGEGSSEALSTGTLVCSGEQEIK